MAEPAAVVERWLDAFNRHDEGGIRAVTAPDARQVAPPDVVLEGEPAVTAYSMAWASAFPDAQLRVHHRTVDGDTVVLEFTFDGTHRATLSTPAGEVPPTDRRLSGRAAMALAVRGEAVAEFRLYFDQVQVMTQLGLMASAAPAG